MKSKIAEACFFVLGALTADSTFGQTSVRAPLDPQSPFYRIIGEIEQLDNPKGSGTAWFFDKAGCLVISNFHGAFGESVDPVTGKVNILPNPAIGHKLRFKFDLNPKSKLFNRSEVATVVDFGNYADGTMSGLRGDLAAMRITPCAGTDFAGPELERNDVDMKNPTGRLMLVSIERNPNGTREILAEIGCRATIRNPTVGIVASNCERGRGRSGSPLFNEGADGVFRVAGIHVQGWMTLHKTTWAIAISGKYLNNFLDSVLSQANVPDAAGK